MVTFNSPSNEMSVFIAVTKGETSTEKVSGMPKVTQLVGEGVNDGLGV